MFDRTSNPRGYVPIDPQRLQAWWVERGKIGAGIVGLPYKAPPAGIGEATDALCREWNLNPYLISGQMDLECAGWQSRIARDKNNPGGHGATNDAPYEKATTFATPYEGIRAVIGHIAGYVYGEGPWNQYSDRWHIVRDNGWGGIVNALYKFEQRYAFSNPAKYDSTPLDQRYGAKIASRSNHLVNFLGGVTHMPEDTITVSNIQGVPFRVSLIPKGNANRPGHYLEPTEGITVHETANFNQGANAEMHRRFVHSGGGAGEVSFHFVVDDHEIIQLLPLNENGWHAGDGGTGPGNRKTWAIEICVNSDGDFKQAKANAAKLVKYLIERDSRTKDKIWQHNRWSGKNCPATMRKASWSEFLAMVQMETPTAPDPNAEKFVYAGRDVWLINEKTVDGHQVDMLTFYRREGGTEQLGLPIEGMQREDAEGKPRYVQGCENVILEYWPEGFGYITGPYYRFGRYLDHAKKRGWV